MFSWDSDPYYTLTMIYIVLAVTHFGVQFVLAHVNYHHQRREEPRHRRILQRCLDEGQFPAVSVIYPIYNEDPKVLPRVLEHARQCLAIPNLELIFVDDGSPNVEILRPIYEYYRGSRLAVIYSENRGKRAAQYLGMQQAKGEFIVTVDSDTLINVDCIHKIIAPLLLDPGLGAVTGDVRVENAGRNLLTQLISMRYWLAFNLERAAQSFTGSMLCCSGPLAVYRANLLHRIKERYIGQRFLGELCTYGDDRHLTNLVLAEGYRTRFQQGAIAYTYVPDNLRDYIVQQTRWNKSFFRELFWTIKSARRISLYALWDVLVQTLLFFLFIAAMAYHLFSFLNTAALQAALAYVLLIIVMASVRAFYGLYRTRRWNYLLFVCYGFLHVAILMPVRFKALLTLKNNRWGTRGGKHANTYGNFALWVMGYFATIVGLAALMTATTRNQVAENLRLLTVNSAISWSDMLTSVLRSWAMAVPLLLVMTIFFVGRAWWLNRPRYSKGYR